jgi:predicted dehydrogenase
MNKAPGLGVIGGGIWAQHHMNAARELEQEGQARLVGMASKTEETRDRVTAQYKIFGTTDYRELLRRDDVHAVSIVTPDHLHREMAIAAMNAGKHVIVEKPMDLTVEGCREMILAARKNRVLLFVDFHKRYDPVHQKARQLILQGKLGRIQYGYAYMEDKIIVPRDWFPKWAEKSTPFWFIGVHQVDLLRWSLKDEVVGVSARGFRGKLDSLGIPTYDSIHAELVFAGGAVFGVDISWILPDDFEALVNQGMRIVGSEGILELDTQDRGFKGSLKGERFQTFNLNAAHAVETRAGSLHHTGYFIEPVKDFLGLVGRLVNGAELDDVAKDYPSGEDGLEATRISLAVHQSVESGRPVELGNPA